MHPQQNIIWRKVELSLNISEQVEFIPLSLQSLLFLCLRTILFFQNISKSICSFNKLINNTSFSSIIYWAGGVAQVVECLPSKCEAANLNPSTVKNIPPKQQKYLIMYLKSPAKVIKWYFSRKCFSKRKVYNQRPLVEAVYWHQFDI
jgi:hypothetical protein